MGEGMSATDLEKHFDTPAYFTPEVMELTEQWWKRTTDKIGRWAHEEGPSPFNELAELLLPHGITDPSFMAELVIAVRFKSREHNSAKKG